MRTRLTVGSLFAGIGGLDLGLERAGMEVRWQVEIDPYCRAVLAARWSGVRIHDDVRTWPLPDTERVDVICGGSPCQDMSAAGEREGLNGQRSGLFFEQMRIVGALRPRWVIWENVGGAFSSGGGGDFVAVLREFSALGYDAEWRCLRASDFGHKHRRERVFLVAYASGDHGRRRIGDAETGVGPNGQRGRRLARRGAELADADGCGRRGEGDAAEQPSGADRRGARLGRGGPAELAGAASELLDDQAAWQTGAGSYSNGPRCAPGPGDLDAWRAVLAERPWLAPAVESGFRVLASRISTFLDVAAEGGEEPHIKEAFPGAHGEIEIVVDVNRRPRLRALGNAVVPDCAEWIGRRIIEYERTRNET